MKSINIHTADIAYRRRVMALVVLCLALSIPLMGLLGSWLNDVAVELRHADIASQRRGLRVLLASLGLAVGVSAAVMAHVIGGRVREIRACGILPPPHWRTLRDVRIIRGAHALAWAKRLAWLGHGAQVLAAVSLLGAASTWCYYA